MKRLAGSPVGRDTLGEGALLPCAPRARAASPCVSSLAANLWPLPGPPANLQLHALTPAPTSSRCFMDVSRSTCDANLYPGTGNLNQEKGGIFSMQKSPYQLQTKATLAANPNADGHAWPRSCVLELHALIRTDHQEISCPIAPDLGLPVFAIEPPSGCSSS
ncbi:hypothetical protein S40293_10682 [Stachybotrys chartarum IBT 40293]|nr:hypothetical protein S40293_10682 [Stachybotrys chartarum IBT 40293]